MKKDALVSEALADVYSSAWYPSNQGRKKYSPEILGFLDQLGRNPRYFSRAVVVQWYSHFEEYLKARVGPRTRDNWGPLTESLRCDRLLNTPFPVQVSTVLRADYCRRVRNLIAHGQAVPDSDTDREVVNWRDSAIAVLKKRRDSWTDVRPESSVHLALDYVLRQAIKHKRAAEREGRRENIEHFYTLFSLTNLDSLAIEIEEALLPQGGQSEGRVTRKRAAIRRADLIVQDSQDAAGQ